MNAVTIDYTDFIAMAWREEALIVSDKRVYEAIFLDTDDAPALVAVLEYCTDEEAIAWVREYQKGRATAYLHQLNVPDKAYEQRARKAAGDGATAILYRVPFINETHVSSLDLWPHDVRIIATFIQEEFCKP